MDFTLETLTFENCDKAYEIDRSDIPEAFVDDVPTLIATLKFGFENNLKGYAFLITKEGRAIGTILLGEGLYCENDPEELKDKPFYRLVSFVLDKNFRGKGLGSKILESTIKKVYNDFGIHPIVLGVHKDNEKAARFYLKNGFTRTSCMDGDDYCFIRNPKKEGIQMKEYKFYGWQTADCKPADPTYEKIQNPRHLYDILSEIWCEYTCAPRLREKWSRENQTVGQCSITAFLAQDIFGGKVYGILRQGGNYHCYNVVGDCVFDLTSEQFGDEKLCYENNPEQFRETHWQKTEKHERYNYLKAELLKKLEEL